MDNGIMERLQKLATATLSDGCDQIAGRRGFLAAAIKGRVNQRKMVGQAATVLAVPSRVRQMPELAFSAIDEATPGSVICIASGGDADIAVWGELMTAGAVIRGHAGAVLDGGTRDVELIRRDTAFPVYARSIVSSSSVGRLITIARDVPVEIGGVIVNPGDYIVGDEDGVVAIPAEHVVAIVAFAEEAEAVEAEMVNYIAEARSLRAAVAKFGRA